MAQTITDFLRWLIVYAVSGGFWHFWAVLLVIWGIAKVTTLVRVDYKANSNNTTKVVDE